VTTGEPFTITVKAAGDQGTSPFTSFNGIVVLTASAGSCAPDSLQLAGGTGSAEIVLSGSVEDQTITASHGGIKGSAKVNKSFMRVLAGDPDDPANEAIPDIEFFADGANYSNDHPDLGDMYVSFNTIMVSFKLGTTVAEANAIIEGQNVKIVGGVPGDESVGPGVLFLKLPTTNHTELAAALAALEANPDVEVAVQDALMGTNAIPRDNGGSPSDWVWENTPTGGNWGLEAMRVPQMWNFNDAVEKKLEVTQSYPPSVLIVDDGFVGRHEDLSLILTNPIIEANHGTHVAGTIGAAFNNGKGVDGIAPYVNMWCKAVSVPSTGDPFQDRESAGQAIISATHHTLLPYHKVVNMSLGYNWGQATINSDASTAAQIICAKQALAFVNVLHLAQASFRTPLFVVSAGNDGNMPSETRQAKYNSPMCYAALELGIESIIVVEAAQFNASGLPELWPFSSTGGHVSAPGWDVTSTLPGDNYGSTVYGSSCAAAHVSGLAAYLLAVEPYLTFRDVRDLIISNAVVLARGGAPFVDAWGSLVDIDRLRVGDPTLEMMCDIDDGSFDGNQRILYYNDNARYDREDIDEDEGIGDGDIDMSDFRRWRDWYLATRTSNPVELSGIDDHPKKDVNYDGDVGTPAEERIYPRGDFNGDGMLDESAMSFVPGAVNSNATDLDVLRALFDDPDYEEWELPDLVESGDVEVHITHFIPAYGATSATLKLWNGGVVRRSKNILIADPHAVITARTLQGGYFITLEISGTEGSDVFEFGHEAFPFEPGDDMWLAPIKTISINPRATYLHVCDLDTGATGTTPINLSQVGIYPGQYILIEEVGYYDGGGGYTHAQGTMAVFSRDDRLLDESRLNRVPGAIDAGEDDLTGATWDCDGEPTDIPQDFGCFPHVSIRVPQGAEYLFIATEDPKYSDNVNTGGFGVQITRIWMEDLN
jgi:subtilisin family serine protease